MYTAPRQGGWMHWDHEVLLHSDANVAGKLPHVANAWAQMGAGSFHQLGFLMVSGIRYEPPDCLHSPYYALRGPYPSMDRELIQQHLKEMEAYGIGVLVSP
ncbi:hypothetical protein Vafri_533 [Volvox africanus]|nr:hypothetical protein Vafri_533 [Volvox africanus]